MSRKKRLPENHDDHNAESAAPAAEVATPMERFRLLTRRLLSVTREQLHAEQDRYENEKKTE